MKEMTMPAILMIGGKGMKEKMEKPRLEDDGEVMGDSGAEAKKEAARALIRAVKTGDVEGVSDALSAHYYACESEEHEKMGYEEEEEGERE
jgi:hypothetical protein